MSRIEQLSIQGIRNFSPESAEVIRFEPPITLIIGKNGSGKTTIIESLKYATTGEMPAGTSKGNSFIHDPKLSTNKMSIGCIKLQFSDEMNNRYIVTRSMEAKFLKSKIDFKTTDGTISLVQPDGKLKSHKNKNSDLNTFVANTLGVSKALLTNVLFCHQEDSNWPLDEAKKVKEKFDEIFNTTRYVKCQDEIRKQLNEVKAKMQSIKGSVERYKMRKDQADECQENARRQTERKVTLEADMEEIQRDKAELDAKHKQAMDQYREAERVKNEINNKKRRLEELDRNRADLESDITQLLSVGIEELECEIEKFQLTKRERERQLNELQREFASLEHQSKQKSAYQQQKLVLLGKLQLEEEQHRKRIAERDRLLLSLAQKYQSSVRHSSFNEPLESNQIDELKARLAETLNLLKGEENETKRKVESEERTAQSEVNKLREECIRLEQDIKAKENALNAKMRELSDVNKKLNDMAESSRQVEILEQQYNEAQSRVQEAEQEVNLPELSREIEKIRQGKGEFEIQLDSARAQLKKAISLKDIRTKLELVQKDLSSKKTQERRLMSRETVEEAIKILIGEHTSNENLLSYYNSRLSAVSDSLSKKQLETTRLNKDIASIESDMRNCRKQLEAKQIELNGFQSKLKNLGVLSTIDLESEVSRLNQEIEELEDHRGLVHGSERMYKHFIEKMAKQRNNADCPLCHREFEDLDETTTLINELESRVQAMPTKKADYERKIADKRSKHSQLLELRPLAESATKLSQIDIPRLESEMRTQEERFKSLESKRKDLEESTEFLKNEEDIGKKAHQDIIQLENLKGEIKKLQVQVEGLTSQLGSQGAEIVTVEDAQSQVESFESQLRSASNRLDALNNRYNSHQRKLAELRQRANHLMERKLQLDNALQQRGNLAERRDNLGIDVEQSRNELEDFKLQLQPKLENRARAEAAYFEAQRSNQSLLTDSRKKVEDLENYSRHLKNLEDEIHRWVNDGKESDLKRSKEEVDSVKKDAEMLENQKKDVQEKISKFQMALNNFENEERNLRNNLKLIVNTTERKVVQAELEKLTQELEKLKVNQLVREINQSEEKLERYRNHLSELNGQLQEIRNIIRDLEEKLQREEFLTAEQRYLENVKDLEIHQAIKEDLENFYNALEWALMKFHKERMSVINRMVREMWHSTYKGKDIDYVEIRAEESAGVGSTARRQYNYRVVMVKSGVEMDMRGRCSAGQKVLASLIIRMALAEAFSSKCGVLALDEPTTNLDEDNIASLSDTILELSNAIARQKRKFQLIVITHDEKFLERMSRDKRMEKFYRVDRNRFNLSEIRQYDVMGGVQSAAVAKKMLK